MCVRFQELVFFYIDKWIEPFRIEIERLYNTYN